MMKRISLALFLICLLAFTACGSNNSISGNNRQDTQNDAVSSATVVDPDEQNAEGLPSARNWQGGVGGQAQGPAADLTGEVSSVSGNTVTLKVIKMPIFERNGTWPSQGGNGGPTGQSPNGDSNMPSSDNPSNASSVSGPSDSQPEQKGASYPRGGRTQRNGQRQQRALEYTGETKTITIPESVTITTRGLGNRKDNGDEQATLSVSDLKQGNILQIWYSDNNKETIARVILMRALSSPAQKGNAQNPSDTSGDAAQK